MKFQVLVPPLEEDGFQITLSVEGKNWMGALKAALTQIGEGAENIRNIVCDVQDDGSYKVTDATTRRVFVVKEMGDAAPAAPVSNGEADAKAAKEAQREAERRKAEEARLADEARRAREAQLEAERKEAQEKATRAATQKAEEERAQKEAAEKKAREEAKAAEKKAREEAKAQETARFFVAKKVEEAQDTIPAPTPKENEPVFVARRVVEDPHQEKAQKSQEIRRPEAKREKAPRTKTSDVPTGETIETRLDAPAKSGADTVEVLTDAFESMMDLFAIVDTQRAVEFVLDQALSKVPSEAGSVLFNDLGRRDLWFVAARGPKDKELLGRRIPLGKGIVGAAVLKHISLAIPDVRQDPRWDSSVSESVAFQTRSILCAPMFLEGRCYGALELINRKAPGGYTRREVSVVTYLAEQLARWLRRRGE